MPFGEDVEDRPELGLSDLDALVATPGPIERRVDLRHPDTAAGQRLEQVLLGRTEAVEQRGDGVLE